MDEWKLAEKLAQEMEISDPGYVFFHLIGLREEFRRKYPGYWVLCLPGTEELAVLPDGGTANPYDVFGEDYPSCREPIITVAGC